MARIYGRKYRRGGKYTKRRRFTKKRGGLGRRVKRVERSVRKINSATETKFTESNTGATPWAVTTTPQTISPSSKTFWNDVGEGASVQGRIGNEFQMKKLNFTFKISSEHTAAPAFLTCVRLLIVCWKKHPPPTALGTSPPLSAVLVPDNAPTLANRYIFAPYNWVYREYYRVLYDKRHYISYHDYTNGEVYNAYGFKPYKYIQKVLKVNKNVKVNVTNGTAITQNAIQVYAVSDQAEQASVWGFCRMTYQDL